LESNEEKAKLYLNQRPPGLEVTHRLMILEAVAILSGVKRKDLVKYLKEHRDTVKQLVTHQGIPARIRSFNVEILSPDIETLVRSQQIKRKYGFLSNDAMTVQIMEDLRIDNLATNDADFGAVNFIRVYGPAPTVLGNAF
jgi:predicted nucleic acid-binding protein